MLFRVQNLFPVLAIQKSFPQSRFLLSNPCPPCFSVLFPSLFFYPHPTSILGRKANPKPNQNPAKKTNRKPEITAPKKESKTEPNPNTKTDKKGRKNEQKKQKSVRLWRHKKRGEKNKCSGRATPLKTKNVLLPCSNKKGRKILSELRTNKQSANGGKGARKIE